MTDTAETGQRDRSPAYPIVPLETALTRLAEFEAHFKRSAARPEKIGDAWGIKAKAYADRLAAALRYFGLLEYQGAGSGRHVTVSEEGRKYLRAQQEEIKREIVKAAALRPKQIAKFWNEWGADRPADPACIDELTLTNGFSDSGARDFLGVYDATISFAKLSDSAKPSPDAQEDDGEFDGIAEHDPPPPSPLSSPAGQRGVPIMDGERVVFTEESDHQRYVKLVAAGEIDETLLDALSDYVKRQRKRLGISSAQAPATKPAIPEDDNL